MARLEQRAEPLSFHIEQRVGVLRSVARHSPRGSGSRSMSAAGGVVVFGPGGELLAGVVEVKNRVSLSSSSRIRPLKLSTEPFWVGLPGAI